LSFPSAFLVYHLTLIYRGITTNESAKLGLFNICLLLCLFLISAIIDYYRRVFKQLKEQRSMLKKVEEDKLATVSSTDSSPVVAPSIQQPSSETSSVTSPSEELSPAVKVSTDDNDLQQEKKIPQLPPGFHFNEPKGYKLVR
jgi:hypothetical protein